MSLIFTPVCSPQMFTFDLQRFASGTVVKIGGIINNVAVGDTFTVSGTNYRILSVESDSVTAMVDGTPADLGKQIVISDTKSIDGVTYQTVDTEEADSTIATKYTYKLDINGNSVFVTVFENAIETVADSGGNVLSATDGNYSIGGTDFTLKLDNGIPTADYVGADSVTATLDTATYSFSVDSKPVEVVVQNDAIKTVSVDSTQVGTAAGSYTVGSQTLNVSYANGSLTTETAPINSVVTITPVTSYTVGDTTVTVDSSGKLSKTSATVDGHTATLTYDSGTKKITATYPVTTTSTTTTGDPNTYIVTLPDDSSVKVTIAEGAISTVTYNDDTINLENSVYTVTASDKIKYALSLEYKENALTATATATDENITATEEYYTVAVGDASTKITVKDKKLYQGETELTATEDIYTVTVGSGDNATEVKLTYDDTNGLKEYASTNVVDLSTLTADYEAQDGFKLTGELKGNYKISIAAGATVTLSNVTINQTNKSKAGIECAGNATITLEGKNTVTGDRAYAGIQAGGENTTLIITGFGSLTARCDGYGGAGIGSGQGTKCGAITINGGSVTAQGNTGGAGIGSGYGGTCGAITISGGSVTANGGSNGAGIGSGYGESGTSTCGAITINGGNVSANGGANAAGIGSGYTANNGTSKCGDITISGGSVTANGGNNGAGIGSGYNATCGAITINNTVTKVTATKGRNATNSIGKGSGDNAIIGTITIPNGTGAQTENYTYTGDNTIDLSNLNADYEAKDGDILTGTTTTYKISIAAGAKVTLSNVTITGNNAAGITCLGTATIKLEGTNSVKGATNFAGIQAGGENTTLTIEGTGSLTAKGGNGDDGDGGAGIGSRGGTTSQCGDITISGGTVTAQGGDGGAGIGSANGGTCGAITISGGTVTAQGGDVGAGIGSGYTGNNRISQCGAITISGGSVTATGGPDAAGIGSGYDSTCGNITINNTVTKVTATKGRNATNSIGAAGNNGTTGTVTIGSKTGAITDDTYTYTPGGTVADISTTTTQTATINDTTITFTTTGTSTTYKIGSDTEQTATITDNKFTFMVGETDVTATVANGKVSQLSYGSETKTENDLKTVTTTSTRNVNSNYDFTATQYTFAVNGKNISVVADSSGNMTYNGQAVTDNKITVDGVEVTLNVSGNEITGANYFGKYSAVTDRTQVDVYNVTIDGQAVKCTFDENNQCNVTVNGKEYLLTKTADGATAVGDKTSTGVEDSRIYLLEVGGEQHFINCAFDAAGNLTGVTSDDEKVTVDGTTVKIGDYTVEVGGTRDALTTTATKTIYGEEVEDVEVTQLFTLSGVKSTAGITVANGVVTLSEANLNGEPVTISGDGYTLALDKDYSAVTTPEHFDGNAYKSASNTDGYEISSDAKSISYTPATDATNLFTLSGVKTTDGITVANNVVTLSEANLNGETVTISGDGYTLALDKNYSSTTTGAHFDGNAYKSESTTESYTVSDDAKSISYTAAVPATNLFTLSGVKSTDGITVANGIVTLTEANLNGEPVTITGDGYTLALDKDYSSTTTPEHFDGNAYKSASNTAGYELSDDAKSINYMAEIPAETLFTLSGVKTTDGITVANGVVTLTEANLNGEPVTITGDGYTLALDKDYSSTATPEHFDGNAYKSASNSDGYEISDDAKSIAYTAEVPAETLFTLSGVKSTDGITVADNVVTLSEANLNGEPVTITGDGYTLALDKDYSSTATPEHFDGNAYKSASNSDGYEISDDAKSISYTPATDAETLFTLSGVKSTDGITVADNVVTLTEANLNGEPVTIDGDGYTLALDKDYSSTTTGAHFDGNAYKSASNSDGYEISDDAKSINYTPATDAETLFTLSGVKSTDGITVANGVVTLTEANLNGETVTITGDGYTLALDQDYSSTTTGAHFDGNAYKSANNTDGYKLSDDAKSISYTPATDAETLFTLSGVKSTDGITVIDKVVTLSETNLNGETVTITGDGYTLALDKDYSAVTTPEHFDGNAYKSASNSDGYEISDDAKSIAYTTATDAETLFTLSGVKSTDGITVVDKVVTLTEANLNGETVTISGDGYTLALDKDYSSTTTPEHFDGNAYKSSSNTDGYEISDDAKSIAYTAEIPAETLFTLSGVKSTDGITVIDKVVTLSEANLNGETVTIDGDGYTLALDKDYPVTTTPEHFDGNAYKSASNTDGYEVSDDAKSISYTPATDTETLFTLSGVKSTDGITVVDNVVTLTEANLNGENVTISGDGYTLALDKDYSSTTTPEHFDGNAYKSASNTDGYEISDDAKSISYTPATDAETLFTLSGVKSTDGITVADNVVTLTEANLNGETVTIDGDGYTLALDKDYSSTTTPEHFDGNAYKSASNSDGYEISDDAKSISYTPATDTETLFTLSGVKSTDGITVVDKVVTLSEANLKGETVTIDGDGYTLALANGITAPTFDNGGWKLSGTTATYTSASNTAGYTVSDDAKSISYTAANDAEILVTVNGVKSIDGLKLSGNVVTVSASSLDGKTVTISEGYTLAIADDVEQPAAKGRSWTQLDDDTYLYTDGGTTAGYTLVNNRIVYSDEVINNEQFTIKGAANTGLISQDDETTTDVEQVEEDSLNRRKVVLIETQAHNSENQLTFYSENYARVTVSSGQDSLITYDNAHSYVDMTNADDVTVVSFNGTVELKNYNIESGSVVLVQDVDKITDAIKTDSVKLIGNEVRINRLSRVAINSADNDSTLVKLTTYDGETQTVGFTGVNGGLLNASDLRENLLLKGNYAETSSAQQKQTGSIIFGGTGNDTILAGSRDFVDGGDGENEIYLTTYNLRRTKDGATISARGNSRNIVNNFNEGFGYDSDIIRLENFRNVKFNFGTSGLSLRSNNSQLLLNGIGVNSSSADAESDFAADSPELLLLTDGQSTLNAVVAQTEQNVLVTRNAGLTPNAFFGNRSGLNFSAYGDAIEVNLSTETGTVSGRDAIFSGINKVQAGDGLSILIGSDEANTLIAGNGYTSLTGGAGNDELFGRSSSVDKDGRTTFFFRDGDGHDVIHDFEFLTAENKFAGTADDLNYSGMLERVFCNGNNVVLYFDDETSLVVTDAAGKDFQVNNLVAKVDTNINFDGTADYYRADGGTSVNVASSVEDAEIWLDNSHDTKFYGDLKILDASAVEGKTSLVGNENDNTIIAGRGDSSLWGGNSSSNDLLIGGESRNTFFYCFGNGNDTIMGANDGDSVILNVSLAEISETEITGDGVTLNFIDGGSLRIEGTADITYQLVDGSKYSANQETRSWQNHA